MLGNQHPLYGQMPDGTECQVVTAFASAGPSTTDVAAVTTENCTLTYSSTGVLALTFPPCRTSHFVPGQVNVDNGDGTHANCLHGSFDSVDTSAGTANILLKDDGFAAADPQDGATVTVSFRLSNS